MQRRRKFWAVLDVDEEEDEELHIFLDKYDLEKRYVAFSSMFIPDTSSIAHKVAPLLMFRRTSFSRCHHPRSATDLLVRMKFILKSQTLRLPNVLPLRWKSLLQLLNQRDL